MIPQQWVSPCGNRCTNKYAALTKIPCNGEYSAKRVATQMERHGKNDCDHICYKDPVLKDQQWSAYIDRSPGAASYSEECFHACVSGCAYKFGVKPEEADKVSPNRKTKPEIEPAQKPKPKPLYPIDPSGDMPGTSA
ncbi:hypothetical protein CR513_01491, partial [Mucuna pruriens]